MCACSLFAAWNIFNLTLGRGPLIRTDNLGTTTIKIVSFPFFLALRDLNFVLVFGFCFGFGFGF